MLPEIVSTKKNIALPDWPSNELSPNLVQKTFHHTIEIYLKDSNAYANTYFARYFEWQGVCRERWFFECISRDMLQSEGIFITKHAEQDYIRETFPFQKVECTLNTFSIKRCSFCLLFRFFVGGELVSSGYQQIVFANHDKRITPLPDSIIAKIRQYEMLGTSS